MSVHIFLVSFMDLKALCYSLVGHFPIIIEVSTVTLSTSKSV
jgi:hypothetical protein